MVVIRRVRRHEIGDIAHVEDFPGLGVENLFGRHARVAAADDERMRVLAALGELAKFPPLALEPPGKKALIAFEKKGAEQERLAFLSDHAFNPISRATPTD